MSGPNFIAVYGGFLVNEIYDTPDGERSKIFTIANVRDNAMSGNGRFGQWGNV